MDRLARELLAWFSERFARSVPGLADQIAAVSIGASEFTKGGGAFITLHVPPKCARVVLGGPEVVALDGPEIRAPELESGALATLFVNTNGEIGSIEVCAYAGDYPLDRHPAMFTLHEPQINYIDLRGDP